MLMMVSARERMVSTACIHVLPVIVVAVTLALGSVEAQRTAEEVRPASGTISTVGNHSAWDAGRAPCEDNLLAITADNTYVDLGDKETLSILGLELAQGVAGGILIGQESGLEIAPPSILESSTSSACPSLRNVKSRMTTPNSISISWEGNNADADVHLFLNSASMLIHPTDVTDRRKSSDDGNDSGSGIVVWHWASDVEYKSRQDVALTAVARNNNVSRAVWSTTHMPVQRAVQWSDQLVQDPDGSVWTEDTAWAPRVPCESDHTLLRQRPDQEAYEVDVDSTVVVSSLQLEKGAGISLGMDGVLELGTDDGSTPCEMGTKNPVFTPMTTTAAAASTTSTTSSSAETATDATTVPKSTDGANASASTSTTTTTGTESELATTSNSSATNDAGASTTSNPTPTNGTIPSLPGSSPSGPGNSTTQGSTQATARGGPTPATRTMMRTTASSTTVNGGKTGESSSTSASIIPAAVGAGGGGLLLIILLIVFLVIRSRKHRKLGPVPARKTMAPAMFDNPAYVGSQSDVDALEPNVLYESASAARNTQALEPNALYQSGGAVPTARHTDALGQEPNVLYEGSSKPAATITLPPDYQTVPQNNYQTVPENDYPDPVYAVASHQQQPQRPWQQRRLQSNPAYAHDERPLGLPGGGLDDAQA